MAKRVNHKCIICGQEYYHCNDCDKMQTFTPWRRVACSVECYQVYLGWLMYREGELDIEQMQALLLEHGFDKKRVLPELQGYFDEILAYKPKKATAKKSSSD